MFSLNSTSTNQKLFYLKNEYKAEESFNYTLEVFNHISKTGFTIDIVDNSCWVSGITNNSTLISGDTTMFYSGATNYINVFPNNTHIFNNIIQISGINYTFYSTTNIDSTKACMLNDNYVIAFDDNGGKIVVVDPSGSVVTGFTFSNNVVNNINIHDIDNDSVVIGYYDTILGYSYLKEIQISTTITQFNPTTFFTGQVYNLKINKISNILFSITYNTDFQGIIQLAKVSTDHIFSVGFPFPFNDDITIYSNSVYQNDNVVVIYYDIDDQLKVRNCNIYDDYIGVGLPTIIKDKYCYDLGIGKLDNNYVYISYYDGETNKFYTSLLKISTDIIVINNEISIDSWQEGMVLTTIDNENYQLSYIDDTFVGVDRFITLSGGTFEDINVEYNLFNIDISSLDYSKNVGHNDYYIYYNNVLIEKGVCHINTTSMTYNY